MTSNMKDFTFTEDFANNWVKDQCVICEIRDNGTVLVDGVAVIDETELRKHGYFEGEEPQSVVESRKSDLKSKATDLWSELQQSGLPYEDFVEVQEFVITLFNDIN